MAARRHAGFLLQRSQPTTCRSNLGLISASRPLRRAVSHRLAPSSGKGILSVRFSTSFIRSNPKLCRTFQAVVAEKRRIANRELPGVQRKRTPTARPDGVTGQIRDAGTHLLLDICALTRHAGSVASRGRGGAPPVGDSEKLRFNAIDDDCVGDALVINKFDPVPHFQQCLP